MVTCDRCNEEKEVANSVTIGSTHDELEDYFIMHICDSCYSKLLQFSEGNDALEDIPLEELSNKEEDN